MMGIPLLIVTGVAVSVAILVAGVLGIAAVGATWSWLTGGSAKVLSDAVYETCRTAVTQAKDCVCDFASRTKSITTFLWRVCAKPFRWLASQLKAKPDNDDLAAEASKRIIDKGLELGGGL